MDAEHEKVLVERAKSDAQAFGALYDEYYGKIFGYVLRCTASVPVAQDITSEVFFKALKKLDTFRWRGIPFSAWLYRIAGHEIANVYIQNGHDRVLTNELKISLDLLQTTLEEEALSLENELKRQTELLALHSYIRQLPRAYQEVITLRFFEKKKLQEIAAILGKRQGTVKSLLHRGLMKLRRSMEDGPATI